MNSKSISIIYLAMLIIFAGFQSAGFAQTAGLQSRLFKGDPKLEACLISDPAHIMQGAVGDHVSKIQVALKELDSANIDAGELATKRYGPSTAAAVLAYKQKRGIINYSYQTRADNVVGKMTIARLDSEMEALERGRRARPIPVDPEAERRATIRRAFERSRESLRNVTGILQRLEADIDRADRATGADKGLALANLAHVHARNIAVVSRRLNVSPDPLSPTFRSALQKARELLQRNLSESSNIIDQGNAGRCVPRPGKGVPFAATTKSDPDPRVSVCSPFFGSNADLQRDVITHEFFHLVGLADIEGASTTRDLLNNANTLAQIVAFLNDRTRQQNSDGNEAAIPPLPMP